MAGRPRVRPARAAAGAALATLVAAAGAPAAAQAPSATPGFGLAQAPAASVSAAPVAASPDLPRGMVLVVNRAAVVDNSAAAQALRDTERDVREAVQKDLDTVKDELEAEEQALTELKKTLAPAAFDERARAFDRRVKEERRDAQERSAILIRFVQEARGALASALPRVLEELRREAGALVILDAAAVASADPSLDVTAEAIARYDREMGAVRFDPPPGLLRD
ncbi:MAG: OmpH family outer membrane protein [Pseudomonadota bacterium]|nr:OmpH family outer membrane protein [Pseudomonadota bacterium]